MELYIHIPFCRQKCRYCSFVSFTDREPYIGRYVDLLLEEASERVPEFTEPVQTVYIGGGTPSLLPAPVFRRLVTGLKAVVPLDQVLEFTCEANPGTVTAEWLDTAAEAGVSRLSLGMQAAQPSMLKMLGRIHRFHDVASSVKLARAAGVGNLNLDLIFGIPEQTEEEWNETLSAALSLSPDHISAYGLIPEPGTTLNADLESGRLSLPDPEKEREMYDMAVRTFGEYGLQQYEISNFARKGYECLHNTGYWTQVPYVGLGVSAASMTGVSSGASGMTCIRRTNPGNLPEYEESVRSKTVPADTEIITPEGTRFETMMLGLRMNAGVDENVFYRMHGVSLEACYGDRLRKFAEAGLAEHDGDRWRLTRRGFDIQNSILVELMDV